MSEGYTLREVGKLLGLSRSIICRLIDAGFVSPSRGSRREYRFTFHDLVLLRAAQALSDAKIPSSRIVRSLRRLRAQLPDQLPFSGLRIEAVGDAVVVSEGKAQWQPDNGQYVLRFQVESPGGRLAVFNAANPRDSASDEQWFEKASALESIDVEQACTAYRRAIRANPTHIAAYTNLGRLLHERGQLEEAEAVYRDGLARYGSDGILLFNLAVLMEDVERYEEAVNVYRAALRVDPAMADAHFNLALLCESQGLQREAVRHLNAFRRITGNK